MQNPKKKEKKGEGYLKKHSEDSQSIRVLESVSHVTIGNLVRDDVHLKENFTLSQYVWVLDLRHMHGECGAPWTRENLVS